MLTNGEIIGLAMDIIRKAEESLAADRGFDAGEFSGPATYREVEKKMDALADKANMPREKLDDLMQAYFNECDRLGHEPM